MHFITRLQMAALGALLMMATIGVSAAESDSQPRGASYDLNIPAQDLHSALQSLALLAHHKLFYTSELVVGKTSPPVKGSFTAEEAIRALLVGTNLTYEFTSPQAVVIRAKTMPVSSSALADQMRVAMEKHEQGEKSSPAEESQNSQGIPEIIVSGKLSVPARSLPYSITAMSQERMKDQQLDTLAEVLAQTPGVIVNSLGGSNGQIFIRGFIAHGDIQVDGVPMSMADSRLGLTQKDMAIFERIEVRRGADGLIQGPGQPSGTIQFVRKKPKKSFESSMEASVARYDAYRIGADVTGPLLANRRLRGRLIGAYSDRQFFYDRGRQDSLLLSGQVEVDVGDSAILRVGSDFDKNNNRNVLSGIPAYSNGRLLPVARSTNFAAPYSRNNVDSLNSYLELESALNQDWKLKLSAQRQAIELDSFVAAVSGAADPSAAAPRTGASANNTHYEADSLGMDAYINGRFEMLSRQHELVFGANWKRSENDVATASGSAGTIPIFGYDPDRDALPIGALSLTRNVAFRTDRSHGIYTNLRSTITERMTTNIGARVSWFKFQDGTTGFRDDGIMTPYAGFIFDLSDAYSLYASYSEIFRSQSNLITQNGQPLDPAVGEQYELGLKSELLDGRLSANLAMFSIREVGRSLVDPAVPQVFPCCFINAGKYQSDGFDIELNGRVLQNFDLSLGYTYNELDIKVNRSSTGAPVNEGLSFEPRVPRHLLKLYASYVFHNDALRGLSVGGGMIAQSETAGNVTGTVIEQGTYGVSNARIAYRWKNQYSLSLNVDNVFDKTYFARVGSPTGGNYYGTPRSWQLTFRSVH